MSRNYIRNLSKEQLQNVLSSTGSLGETISKLGLAVCGAHYKSLSNRITEEGLDISHFSTKRFTLHAQAFTTHKLEDMLTENSTFSRGNIKKRLLRAGVLVYKCSCCGNDGTWQNKKLTLQLDHINGIRDDNRLENLRLLCPNCHSQTHTYAGRSKPKSEKRTFPHIDKRLGRKPDKPHTHKIVWPDKESLSRLVWSKPTSHLAKELGVSDAAINKRCIRHGITKPPAGYWLKRVGDTGFEPVNSGLEPAVLPLN